MCHAPISRRQFYAISEGVRTRNIHSRPYAAFSKNTLKTENILNRVRIATFFVIVVWAALPQSSDLYSSPYSEPLGMVLLRKYEKTTLTPVQTAGRKTPEGRYRT